MTLHSPVLVLLMLIGCDDLSRVHTHVRRAIERIMDSRVSTYNARSVVVIPAPAGIPAAPWIVFLKGFAGMTFPLYLHAHGIAFNMLIPNAVTVS